jgi:hypothetical protein
MRYLNPIRIPLDFRVSKKLDLFKFMDSIIYTIWIREFMVNLEIFGSLAGFWNLDSKI